MSDEPKYTLREAEIELRRRECAIQGHRPWTEMRGWNFYEMYWICDCKSVKWIARDWEATR